MKVFVAGASGAVGRPLVRQLLEAGHEVTGMTRFEDRAEDLRRAGADAVVCDVFDSAALEAATAAAEPEVVVHALTALPDKMNLRRDYLAPTNRLRDEGTRRLIAAARAAGARRIIAESVAFVYAPGGPGPSTEEDPMYTDAPGYFTDAVAALTSLESQVLAADGLEGVVLRLGWFYGPGTHFASDGSQAEEVRKRRLPIVGSGDSVFSFIHVEDAAASYVAALDESRPPGVYNVVDDEPAAQHDWVPVYAETLGAKGPRRVPTWLARLVVGSTAIAVLDAMHGASNATAKRDLGWSPRYPSWRQGFREALG